MDIDGIFLKIAADFSDVTSSLQGLESELSSSFASLGGQLQDIGKGMTLAITAPLVALGTVGLKAFGDFEATMNRVGQLSEATGTQMDQLSQLALKLGADTQFSAKQAADAMAEFAAQGYNTKEIMAGIPGVLALAAAGQIDLAKASEIASSILKQYGLDATHVGEVSNVLAAAANASAAGVGDLGSAFSYAGPVAKQAGLSLSEAAAALAIFADAGSKGEKGGTALRAMLASLEAPSKKAAGAMKELGINVKDSQGNMLPFAEILTRLGPLATNAEAGFQIFGKRFTEVLALINRGPEAFTNLSKSIENAANNNAAQKMAENLFKGWNAAWESFKGSIETTSIAIGKVLSGPLGRLLTEVITPAVNKVGEMAQAFGKLPQPVQNAGVALVALVAAAGPAVYSLGKILEITSKLAVAETFSKSFGVLSSALTSIAPNAKIAVDALKGLPDTMGALPAKAKAGMDGLTSAVTGALGALSTRISTFSWAGLTAGVSAAAESAGGTLAALAAAGGPIALVVAGIAAIGVAGYQVVKNWDDIKATLAGIWADIKSAAETAFSGIKEKINEAIGSDFIQGLLASLREGQGKIADALEPIGKLFTQLFNGIGTGFAAIGDVILKNFPVQPIVDVFVTIRNGIYQAIGPAFVKQIATAWNQFADAYYALADNMMHPIRTLVNAALAAAEAIGAKGTAAALLQWSSRLEGVSQAAELVRQRHIYIAEAVTQVNSAYVTTLGHVGAVATGAKTAATHTEAIAAAAEKSHISLTKLRKEFEKINAESVGYKWEEDFRKTANEADILYQKTQKWREESARAGKEIPEWLRQVQAAQKTVIDTTNLSAYSLKDLQGVASGLAKTGEEMTQGMILGLKNTATEARNTKTIFGDFGADVKRSFDNFTDGIVANLVQWKGFGDTVKRLGSDIKNALIHDVVEGGLKAISKELLNVESSFGHLGQVINSVFGGGGSAPKIPGVTGPGSSPGAPATSAITSSLTSVIGVIANVGTLISSVIGNFQNARQEKTLNAIEESTRYSKSYLRDNIIPLAQQYWPRLDNLAQLIRLEGIEQGIQLLAQGGGQGMAQAIADGFKAFADSMRNGFQMLIDQVGGMRSMTFNQLSVIGQILAYVYNVLSKPGWSSSSLPSMPGVPTSSSSSSTSRPSTATQSTQTVINVQSTSNSPYNVGVQVAQGFNAVAGVRQ